tara:strand:- start:1452 stop:1889 length:438 start_codon:yes stop_codon:yes gene_type:complete
MLTGLGGLAAVSIGDAVPLEDEFANVPRGTRRDPSSENVSASLGATNKGSCAELFAIGEAFTGSSSEDSIGVVFAGLGASPKGNEDSPAHALRLMPANTVKPIRILAALRRRDDTIVPVTIPVTIIALWAPLAHFDGDPDHLKSG